MRLLHAKTAQIFEFYGNDIPPYVILSHTWGDEEVTFQDMQNGKGSSKRGYIKIVRRCEEAV